MSKIRREDLERAVENSYGINTLVHYEKINSNAYEITIEYSGKKVLLKDVMNKGSTSTAILTINGDTKNFKRYVDAERSAINYLKG